ncbi:uncharacterized protein LOC129607499 [Condylostylus longicornis]|uniref:uncharacterized protein LOC129607499 n=1 Tax=Condylostylus longicornis TaxID=2530218 RepID=UPI00244DF512|nr:uncharacterized protein LOC129607499 [Condylostylus longicornis]
MTTCAESICKTCFQNEKLHNDNNNCRSINNIKEFYKNSVILITGGTGFLGKALLEKLLRSCSDIQTIYILLRPKRGLSTDQRHKEFLEHHVFDKLKKSKHNLLNKIKCLPGDITKNGLGLSENDMKTIIRNVNIVFHSAATVKFTESLKNAGNLNAYGTLRLMEICSQMPQLKVFIHVSTAYCNPGRKYVGESVYSLNSFLDKNSFMKCISILPNEVLDFTENQLKGPHPNTYTFTKSIAEQIVSEYSCRFPIGIIRPSIITAAVEEPSPGWVDNIQGITGIMMEIGRGTISTILGDENLICDIIPIDIVVNSMIGAAWDVGKSNLNSVKIFNCTSGQIQPITWKRLGIYTTKWARMNPTKYLVLYPRFRYSRNIFIHHTMLILLHYIPAISIDLILRLQGYKPISFKIAKKLQAALLTGSFFSLREWIFDNENQRKLCETISAATDGEEFNCNIEKLNYDDYIRNYMMGIRKFILKDEDDSMSSARKKLARMTRNLNFQSKNFDNDHGKVNSIQEFYKNSVILITGATGFIGKALVEKLLRSCPDIQTIYILLRSKRGIAPERRYQQFLEHHVFNRIIQWKPSLLNKIKYVSGDISENSLGLSEKDMETIIQTVNIVFHSAATVNLKESLKNSINSNVCGTLRLLEICSKMHKLKVFIHVSTAFCFPERKYVEESVYNFNSVLDKNSLMKCTNILWDEVPNFDDNELKELHPNTYTFAKSIAEQIVNEYSCKFPIGIIRPSIITAAVEEPTPGWVDNIQGLTGILMEIGRGTISTVLANENLICDIIPVDIVVKSMIGAAWDIGQSNLSSTKVFNCTSGQIQPITWKTLRNYTIKWARINPTKFLILYPRFHYTKNLVFHYIILIVLHYIPAIITDLISLLQGYKPVSMKIAKQIEGALLKGSYVSLRDWIFDNKNQRKLCEQMNVATDGEEFNCSIETLNYDNYMLNYMMGIRKFILKDEDDSIPSARRKLTIIKEFYKNSVILITGGTGFVGKSLVEKLLRSCPDIKIIYILLRPKREMTLEQRYKQFLEHHVFNRIIQWKPSLLNKIKYLSGDISKIGLGLSKNDMETVIRNVNIVFHSAATIKVTENLKTATNLNACGTFGLLEICSKMHKLKVFIHVSTAFCFPERKYVGESIYHLNSFLDKNSLMKCTKILSDEVLNFTNSQLKGLHPNTYTFTKLLAEEIVNEYCCQFPIGIIRPSIITAAIKEPFPGWVDNVQALTGIMMEIGRGTISTMLADENVLCDIIPIDIVVNSMIGAAWDVGQSNLNSVKIFNCTSGQIQPLTWKNLRIYITKWARKNPTKYLVFYPRFRYTKYPIVHYIMVILLHYIPAIVIDLMLKLQGNQPIFMKTARKLQIALRAGSYVTLRDWVFDNKNQRKLSDKINGATDGKEFNCNIEKLDYDDYIRNYMIGIRKFILKDEDDSMVSSRKKLAR